ncbi:hypothetical protein BH23CHL7_BH23CHL7_24040 [soil metagenome]
MQLVQAVRQLMPGPVSLGRLVIVLAAMAVAAATAVGGPMSGLHVVARPAGISLLVGSALALLAAGALVVLAGPRPLRGLLAAAAALAALGPAWEAALAAPAVVRAVAALATHFFLPLAMHVVVSGRGVAIRHRAMRAALLGAYLAASTLALTTALLRDPFLDLRCLPPCDYNVFLLASEPAVVRAVQTGWAAVEVVVGFGLALASLSALWSMRRSARFTASPPVSVARVALLGSGAVLGAWAVSNGVIFLLQPALGPFDSRVVALAALQAFGVAGLALQQTLSLVHERRARASVARLAAELGEAPEPGTLAAVLAEATGDPHIAVLYPLPDGRVVDGAGEETRLPTAGEGRAIATLALRGRPIAYVAHDAGVVDNSELRQQISTAARLAIENERLQAELLAQLGDLRRSRERVVRASDAERRRLERDLHDGAQQRVLALGYDIQLAVSAARAAGNEPAVDALQGALREVELAGGGLRDVAHGIYPAILTEAGLAAALMTLRDVSPVPVEIRTAPSDRLPEGVERTAFEIVAESVRAATVAQSASIDVWADQEGERLVVIVDGVPDIAFTHASDRVGAVGGWLAVDGSQLRAEIPCASS